MYRYLLLCCFLVILADRHAQFRFIPGPQFEPCQFLALHDSRDSWTGHPFRDFCQIHTNLANKMPKSSKCTVVWFINSEFLLQFSQKKHEENTWSFMNFPIFFVSFESLWIFASTNCQSSFHDLLEVYGSSEAIEPWTATKITSERAEGFFQRKVAMMIIIDRWWMIDDDDRW